MTQKVYYQHKFSTHFHLTVVDLIARIADVKDVQMYQFDFFSTVDIVLVCELDGAALIELMRGFPNAPELIHSLKSRKYDSQAYRDDEIAMIYKHCKTIPELKNASKSLGYLTAHGWQIFRPVSSKLYTMRLNEILKNNSNV